MKPLQIDEVMLNFSEESLFVLNIILGIIMFGVALNLKLDDFKRILLRPQAPLVGLVSQFLWLPFITFLMVILLPIAPSMALGMLLVSVCPGGNISNFVCSLAKGNIALSVSLTAISTLLAAFITPFNFAFWANSSPHTAQMLQAFELSVWEMAKTVGILLGVPLVLGMWTAHRFPKFTKKITQPIKILSILFFAGFVIVALANNFSVFMNYIEYVILLVFFHNALALLGGYGIARAASLPAEDVKAISIETGIQNSGIALIIIFNFFDGLGGMAIIAAWWGIWHIVAGLTLAYIWSKGSLTQFA